MPRNESHTVPGVLAEAEFAHFMSIETIQLNLCLCSFLSVWVMYLLRFPVSPIFCIWNFVEWNFFNSYDSILNKANDSIIYFYTHYCLQNTFTCISHSFKFIPDIFLKTHHLIIILNFRAVINSKNRILLRWILEPKLQVYDSFFLPKKYSYIYF